MEESGRQKPPERVRRDEPEEDCRARMTALSSVLRRSSPQRQTDDRERGHGAGCPWSHLRRAAVPARPITAAQFGAPLTGRSLRSASLHTEGLARPPPNPSPESGGTDARDPAEPATSHAERAVGFPHSTPCCSARGSGPGPFHDDPAKPLDKRPSLPGFSTSYD